MATRIIALAAVLLTVLLAVGYVRGGRPVPVCLVSGQVVRLLADDESLVWLAKPKPADPGAALYALPRNADSPTCLHPDPRLAEIVLAGDRVLALERDGERGAILSIPRSGGGETRLAEGLVQPAGIVEHDGMVYWTETVERRPNHVHHVPALRARTTIRRAPAAGGPSQPVAALEGQPGGFLGELLGGYEGRLYWLDRRNEYGREGWSEVQSAPLGGGVTETLTVERSAANHAVLEGGTLFLTAPSEDAGQPLSHRCVRRVRLPGGEPETLTDWLPPGGRLARQHGRTYYFLSGGPWAVPNALAPPTMLPRGAEIAGEHVAVRAGSLYGFGALGEAVALYRMPLTFVGRLSTALVRRGPDAP